MDADLFKESVEYERLTQSVYQAIVKQEGHNIDVQHNVSVPGKSGVEHQVDVLWRFQIAGVEHLVLIECKNYATALTLEKVRNFFAVLHDIGNCNGLMVTRTGFQSGVVQFANHYGIGLKLLRPPKPEDWEGRVKDIQIDIRFKGAASTNDRPIRVGAKLAPADDEQEARLKELQQQGRLAIPSAPTWSSGRLTESWQLTK